jgi:hypothetical protein
MSVSFLFTLNLTDMEVYISCSCTQHLLTSSAMNELLYITEKPYSKMIYIHTPFPFPLILSNSISIKSEQEFPSSQIPLPSKIRGRKDSPYTPWGLLYYNRWFDRLYPLSIPFPGDTEVQAESNSVSVINVRIRRRSNKRKSSHSR